MFRNFIIALVTAFLLTVPALAQSQQARVLIHPTADLDDKWFVSGWIINNAQSGQPDNTNLLAGIGRRWNKGDNKGDVEFLFQQHWNPSGNQQLLDIRLNQRLGKRWSLYAEVAPFLKRPAVYDFFSLEANLTKRLSLGIETENVHQPGRDSLGAGPRATYLLKKWPTAKLVLAGSYQFRPHEPNVARVYLILHLRLRKH